MHATSFACSTAAQVLAHYLMIDQLSATADCCQQTALEGSEPLSMIVDSSEQWDATSRIDGGRPVLLSTLLNLQCFSNPRFPVSFPLTMSSNGG